MSQCEGKTKTGRRCHKFALAGKRFCHVHADTIDLKSIVKGVSVATGTLLGHAVAPGVGGAAAGAGIGYLFGDEMTKGKKMKKRVFVSFDFDNDKKLKDFIIGQSRLADSPFEAADHSLKEAAPEKDWEKKAHAAIARSDIVLVMVGPKTHRAQGVLKEVAMARDLGRKIVQVIGYKDGDYTRVSDAGQLYSWNWPNLKKLLA